MLDYHIHTSFSCDSQTSAEEYLIASESFGISEVCFTDHIDRHFSIPGVNHVDTDFALREAHLSALRYSGKTRFKRGVEIGLFPKDSVYEESKRIVEGFGFDYVIASIHILGETDDPYSPEYFERRSRKEGYTDYLKRIYECISAYSDFDALGHMFCPARACPFGDRDFRLSDAPELVDAIFKLLISRGQTLEINTQDFRRAADIANYVAVYRRFIELGGEFCTVGTDSHGMNRFGRLLGEGYELARAAGLKYMAGYDARKPVMHKL